MITTAHLVVESIVDMVSNISMDLRVSMKRECQRVICNFYESRCCCQPRRKSRTTNQNFQSGGASVKQAGVKPTISTVGGDEGIVKSCIRGSCDLGVVGRFVCVRAAEAESGSGST